MYIKPTKEAKGSIFDIHEDTIDCLLYPANDDVPCPWDADIEVVGGKVVIVGNLGPSGPATKGANCTCECSVEDFVKYYRLECPDDNDELLNALSAAGWERA